MRKPRLKKWTRPDNTIGLLLFAQVLEEILFHHTVDSFKSPALNTHTCVLELRSLASDLIKGVVRQGALNHVLLELENRFKSDPVIEGDWKDLFLAFLINFKNCLSKPEDLMITANALLDVIEKQYWHRLKSKLLELLETAEEKGKIIELVRILSNEIELFGYSKNYLYFETLSFFFNEQKPPDGIYDNTQLLDFLSKFEVGVETYEILFRANSSFRDFHKYLKPFKINIYEELPHDFNQGNYRGPFFDANDEYPLIIHFSELKNKDRFSARENASSNLDFIADILSFHDHKADFKWQISGLVRRTENDDFTFVKPPPDPMKRGVAARLVSVESIEQTIQIMQGIHFDVRSRYLFTKAIDYHRSAIQASTAETQLVSLWAAIEGFLPPPKQDENQARIEQYCDYLLPSLVLTYTEKIFKSVSDDLYNCGRHFREFIERIGIDCDFIDKSTCLLVSSDMGNERKQLFEMLHENPLLKYRCYWCNEHFRNSKRIRESVCKHRERTKWHIQRIYTTRNQIVHSASALPYLHTLVENLHTYFDVLLSSIINIGVRSSGKISIPTAIRELFIYESCYLKGLEGQKINCHNQNFKSVLFPNMP